MADYEPPTENLPEFNPAVFRTNDVPLTITEAERLFLKFPTAQGTETLQSAVIAGKLSTTNGDTKSLVYGYQTTENGGSGLHNTAFGYQAGKGYSTLTTGGGNTAFGAISMSSITTSATNNTAIGHNALFNLSTGSNNTAVGTIIATTTITSGTDNTLVGYNAKPNGNNSFATIIGSNAKNGASGVSVGYYAGSSITTALNNIAIGSTAIGTITNPKTLFSGSDENVCVGIRSGYLLSGATTARNVALGNRTLGGGRATTDTTTGADNVCVGYLAGGNLQTGSSNTIVGSMAGDALVGGTGNVLVGIDSGSSITGGGSNTIVGSYAGTAITTVSNNTAVGYECLKLVTSPGNTGLGASAGIGSTNATNNVFIGLLSGSGNTTGDNNVFLGANTTTTNNDIQNAVVIGASATSATSNSVTLGRVDTDSVRLNKITPMYSSLSFGTGDIGYQYSLTLNFTTPADAAVVATTETLPIGVWAFNISAPFTGTYNTTGFIYLVRDEALALSVGFFPIVASASGSLVACVNGSAIVSVTTPFIYKFKYGANASSQLTNGPVYRVTVTRIA